MSAIEFYFDADGQKRWRITNAGNHEIVGAATEGYHNLGEAADNLVEIVQTVVREAYYNQTEYVVELSEIENIESSVRDFVLGLAAKGITESERVAEQTDFSYIYKEPKGFA